MSIPSHRERMFELVSGVYPPPAPMRPGEVRRGDSWSLFAIDGRYVLEYESGELGGRVIRIDLTQAEGEGVRDDRIDAEKLIIAYQNRALGLGPKAANATLRTGS